jgi:hypothetical protein
MPEEPKIPTAIEGLETFSLAPADEDDAEAKENAGDYSDADSFFSLPDGESAPEDDADAKT